MKTNQKIIIAIVLVIVLVAAGIYIYQKNSMPSSDIAFPSGGETLIAGKTYTLKWKNSGATGAPQAGATSIFLVDQALLNQGASVSITDRIYDVPDTGSYEYTIPTAVQDSTYLIIVGTTTSNAFKITSVSQ